MNIQTVSLSQLVPSKSNPRRKFDAGSIEGLAASIGTDGLLQNLVVSPVGSKRKQFSIVSGERRYRALKLLEERGQLPGDFSVPVEVREDLTKDQSLRIATVENLQRADLAPLEQTAALTKLIHKGASQLFSTAALVALEDRGRRPSACISVVRTQSTAVHASRRVASVSGETLREPVWTALASWLRLFAILLLPSSPRTPASACWSLTGLRARREGRSAIGSANSLERMYAPSGIPPASCSSRARSSNVRRRENGGVDRRRLGIFAV